MTNNELKTAVADKLAESGIWANKRAGINGLCQAVIEHTGVALGPGEKPYTYLVRYAGIKQRESTAYVPAFKPLRVVRHPRLSEIERAQPPMMTPDGIGNGAERIHGYGRG